MPAAGRPVMRQRTRALLRHGLIWGAVGAALAASVSALAQIPQRQLDPNQRQVVLVRQDTSDCSGSDVPNVDSPLVGGTLWATQLFDGNTSVKIAMTTRPNTTYRIVCLPDQPGRSGLFVRTVGRGRARQQVPERADQVSVGPPDAARVSFSPSP